MTDHPSTLRSLRTSEWSEERVASHTIRFEMRERPFRSLEQDEPLFQGIHGFEETVNPQVVYAILSQRTFILLGLRGQSKCRLLRSHRWS